MKAASNGMAVVSGFLAGAAYSATAPPGRAPQFSVGADGRALQRRRLARGLSMPKRRPLRR